MKIKLFVIIQLCSFYCFQSFAQTNQRILIYANKSDFLVPYIKTNIQELKKVNTKNNLFSEVKILNLLFSSAEADKLMRSAFDYYSPKIYNTSDSSDKLRDSMIDYFADNDQFLLINQNVLQDNIEFQLVLFEIIKNKSSISEENKLFPLKNVIFPKAENNFFININDPNYKDQLKNGIKKLFPQTNYKTEFSVEFEGNLNQTSTKTFTASLFDSISVKIMDIYDRDNVVEKLEFIVNVNTSTSLNDNRKYRILNKDFLFSSKFLFKDTGDYYVFVECDDGVGKSVSDTFNFQVINVPRIVALKNEIKLVYTEGLFRQKNISIDLPLYAKDTSTRTDLSEKFAFDVGRKVRVNKDVIIDSILMQRNRQPKYYNSNKIESVNGHYYLYQYDYFREVKKVSPFLYNLSIKSDQYFFDSLINVYLINDDNVKSNIEKIKIKQTIFSLISLKSGISNGNLFMERNNCNCGDSTISLQYFDIKVIDFKLKMFSIKDFDFGIFISLNNIIKPKATTNQIGVLKSIKGGYQKFGLSISKLIANRNTVIELGGNIFFQSLPVDFLPSNANFNPKYKTILYGGEINVNVIPENLKGFGIFFQVGGMGNIQNEIKYSGIKIGGGLSYNPFKRLK